MQHYSRDAFQNVAAEASINMESFVLKTYDAVKNIRRGAGKGGAGSIRVFLVRYKDGANGSGRDRRDAWPPGEEALKDGE
jgi:hypothetical protein